MKVIPGLVLNYPSAGYKSRCVEGQDRLNYAVARDIRDQCPHICRLKIVEIERRIFPKPSSQ